ncbi:hypothetical protein HRI_001234400 [Hibiscus trionum]|uniref:Uncharacterized protein n=1 Tax=Hibiscus trionum TaxID=183268 RepID=A0A9W7LTV6_HIBTR|nr:hypothetical protein HRI_001234400 [Hibiscus trionum]
MEERLENVEQACEDIRRDIESRLEKTQQETRDHISQSQEDLFVRLAAMLTEKGSEKKKGVVINPSALTEDPSLPLKTHVSIETPAAKHPFFQTKSSLQGEMTTHDDPSEYVVPDVNECDKLKVELPKQLED